MSDLISRQEAIDFFKNCYTGLSMSADEAYYKILYTLRTLPSTEPEHKKGKWQRRKDEDCWECSECHAVLENSDVGNHNYYYCYHCGANMMDICGYMDLEKANYE